jgi:hypothetical protein
LEGGGLAGVRGKPSASVWNEAENSPHRIERRPRVVASRPSTTSLSGLATKPPRSACEEDDEREILSRTPAGDVFQALSGVI